MRKLRWIGITALMVAVMFGSSTLCPLSATNSQSSAQGTQTEKPKVEGNWNGTLDAGLAKLRLVLRVVNNGETLSATLDSPDQGATGLKVDKIGFTETSLSFEMTALSAIYEGKFSKDGSEIEGEWKQQGQSLPLIFKRAAKSEKSLLNLERIDVGGHSLNFLIGGKGSPAVILEGGFGAGIASWSPIQAEVATFAQTVSYDRAGLGQSQLGPNPRAAKQIATELHAALQKAGIKPPYVMVGHSLGGIFVRVFVDAYPAEVAGLVLIDPSQEAFNEWTRTRLPERRQSEKERMSKAPEGPRAEWSAVEASYAQARAAKVPPGIPVVLLSATEDEGMPAEARAVWIEKHKAWITTIPGGRHIIADKSGHFIQLAQPQLVIDAVRQVVSQSRKR